MNEEMIVLWLQQTEHTRSHLWHIYSVMVYQVMESIKQLSKWWLQLNHRSVTWRVSIMELKLLSFSNVHEFTSGLSEVLLIFSVLCSVSKAILCHFACCSILYIALLLNSRFILNSGLAMSKVVWLLNITRFHSSGTCVSTNGYWANN